MPNYYFLGTLLPELVIGQAPDYTFEELDQLLRDNLSEADYGKTKVIRSLFDIFNLKAYWKKESLDRYGNLDFSDLEEALAFRSIFPEFVFNYMDKYESLEERLSHYPELLVSFCRHAIINASGFLKFYLNLERELRLVILAFRAKMLGRDVYKELQYEDPEEDLIAQILAQKDASLYQPPEKYEEVATLLEKYRDKPVELQKALLTFRFKKIEEKLGIELFSLDRILAYMIELIMGERWQRMDKEKGLKIVESILKEPS